MRWRIVTLVLSTEVQKYGYYQHTRDTVVSADLARMFSLSLSLSLSLSKRAAVRPRPRPAAGAGPCRHPARRRATVGAEAPAGLGVAGGRRCRGAGSRSPCTWRRRLSARAAVAGPRSAGAAAAGAGLCFASVAAAGLMAAFPAQRRVTRGFGLAA